ncbi:MAG: outer membrane protein assembly factor BamA [Bacteroidetes bacterium GWF2_38_335]|nr:MAG: outer membrane protein assembly factor BamA [Bacteroidetes bacterium GWF2_38_335]OFY80510.1 MAG: outer membrane protein assembly factor BamA [Bacteroidetes bacterium RIFOXYA12_FULL_38_20]
MQRVLFLFLLFFVVYNLNAQITFNSNLDAIDYSTPKEYEIGGITVSGVNYLDQNVLIHLSGLSVGDRIVIPGIDLTDAIKNLWKQELFSNIEISATKITGDVIFLDIKLEERPRLSKFTFSGIKRSEADDLREEIKFMKAKPITENVLINAKNTIKEYYIDKGYRNVEVVIDQEKDTLLTNNVILLIKVKLNNKIKINEIAFEGNSEFSDKKLKRQMKDTKQKLWYNLFKTSKFIQSNYKTDKDNIIAKYNEKGYRDARITKDSVFDNDQKTINIKIKVDEGKKYYFGNITWVGNTKYSTQTLNDFLGIKKGDVYNQTTLDGRLLVDADAVSSLYLDNGYLFFSVTPAEVKIDADSIDIEMRIVEGKQARINNITITGNSKTAEHVIRRELKTVPGELFRRSDIIRSHRELAQLNYFDPEKLDVKPVPDPVNGTVDLEYVVEEKASDQIELSGGFGAGMIVGTLGLSFNNFAAKRIFEPRAWRPLPSGGGQKISMRAQSNGLYYQAYSTTFIEPWLGGKKPNSFSVSIYNTTQTNGQKRYVKDTAENKIVNPSRKSIQIFGASLGLGKRLTKPDDYFTVYYELSFQRYTLDKWTGFIINEGKSNNISIASTIGRKSSGPNPIFPTSGSSFSATLQVAPPWYSMLKGENYWKLDDAETTDLTASQITQLENEEHYKWIEFHKWTFQANWFTPLARKLQDDTKSENTLVLNTGIQFGFLGRWSKNWGYSPFEGYEVGGDGLAGYNLYGREIVSLRGYSNRSLTPEQTSSTVLGANFFDKFTMELRYPLSLNPNATFYVLGFLEGGNAWHDFKEFNPFEIKRSAGVGVRIFLPMFGMLGVDWGYGFDDVYYYNGAIKDGANGSQFHFVIGQQF